MVEIKMSVNGAGGRKLGNWVTHLWEKSKRISKVLREIMYGMTVHEMDLEVRRERGDLGHLFMLVVFGDLMGLPLFPPYYSMRFFTLYYPILKNLGKKPFKGERPDRFCFDGYLTIEK